MSLQFRITERSLSDRALAGLQGSLTRLGDIQQQLSSGKLISRPSDSPTGTVQSLRLRDDIRRNEAYGRNADDGLGWLGMIDATLTGAMDQIQRVRDLTLQGMNTGASSSGQAQESVAVEIDNLRVALIGVANTTFLGRPVFGGTTAGAVAFDQSGAYVGDGGTVRRTVGAGASVRVDAAGTDVFGTGPTQLFTVLSDISRDLRGNPSALGTDLGNLDTAFKTLQNQAADVGARYNRVAQNKQLAADQVIELRNRLSDVEDIDLPKTITELQLQQTAYQAALAATSKVIQPSLVDYLK